MNGPGDDVVGRNSREEHVAKPTLYSSVVQTERKLRQLSLDRPGPKPTTTNKTQIREVNFTSTQQMFDYTNIVDVGLNSGVTKSTTKPKPREARSTKTQEPKLSDYYRPSFNNVQRIQMDNMENAPELTIQYDGLALFGLLNDVDDLIFQ